MQSIRIVPSDEIFRLGENALAGPIVQGLAYLPVVEQVSHAQLYVLPDQSGFVGEIGVQLH